MEKKTGKTKKPKRKTGLKSRIINIVGVALLLAGICILLYPTVSNWLNQRNATQLIQNYDRTVEEMLEEEREAEWLRAAEYNNMLRAIQPADPFLVDESRLSADYYSILNIGGMIGHVEIDKINVNLPIFHGTSERVLQKGAGHFRASAFPIGRKGDHAVVTAHTGLPSAMLFTRLNEMEIGDTFNVTVLNEVMTYEVDQIKIVSPNDTSYLQPIDGEDHVTLVTCTPYAVNSHRLLVRGIRTDSVKSDADGSGVACCCCCWCWILWIPVMLLLVIILIILSRFYRRYKRDVKKREEQMVRILRIVYNQYHDHIKEEEGGDDAE